MSIAIVGAIVILGGMIGILCFNVFNGTPLPDEVLTYDRHGSLRWKKAGYKN